MVAISTIREANRAFIKARHRGYVCVFIGATSGIGLSTLTETLRLLQHSTFYVIGRSQRRFATQLEELRAVNSSCTIVFLEAEVSLLSNVDAACETVRQNEGKADVLCMSAGTLPIGPRLYTAEGIDRCFALSYYSRLRFVQQLMPLLRASSGSRVLSILNGGKETRVHIGDLDLQREQHYAMMAVVNHTTTMTSLSLDYLAAQEPSVAFLHAYPGWVKTEITTQISNALSSTRASALKPLVIAMIELVLLLFGTSLKESGERHAYYLTSAAYRCPEMNRVQRISWRGDDSRGPKAFLRYKADGFPKIVWEHTLRVFDGPQSSRAQVKGSSSAVCSHDGLFGIRTAGSKGTSIRGSLVTPGD